MENLNTNDYIVIDIENPNKKCDSVCSIGIIKVKDNKIVFQNSFLIDPEDNFDDINMRINKITPSQVKGKQKFNEFWQCFKDDFLSVIVGHNVIYDLSVISKTLKKYNIDVPKFNYICTKRLSQKYVRKQMLSLPELCEFFKIKQTCHHDALDDCIVCKELLENIIKQNNIILSTEIFQYCLDNEYIEKESNNTTVKSLNSLKGIIEGITTDNEVSHEEILKLNDWINKNEKLSAISPFDNIFSKIRLIVNDYTMSPDKQNELIELLSYNQKSNIYKDETQKMQVLLGFVEGLLIDNNLSDIEINKLYLWLKDNRELVGNYPYDKIFDNISKILEDNIITENERIELIQIIKEFTNPLSQKSECKITFDNKLFCLTGNFESGTKDEISNKIRSKGSEVVDGVNSKVNYLVVGGSGSESWRFGNYGSKVNKALEMQNKGHLIQIFKEQELLDCLK